MKREDLFFVVSSAATGVIFLALLLIMAVSAGRKPAQIKKLQREIESQQERLISAQIMAEKLNQVQQLITANLALSSTDTLAQGGSLRFLRDLTTVLDNLQISLVSLEPEPSISGERSIETPYRVELICTYTQFCELVNKMEKSPRLISISQFEIANPVEDYFNNDKLAQGQCRISMRISTLTLVRKEA